MNINPQYIERLASEVFWTYVFNNDLKSTGFPTEIEDIPEDLWSREILLQMLINTNNMSQDQSFQNLIETIYYGVAETIVNHNRKDKNIIGIIYEEDFKSCKAHNFDYQDLVDNLIGDSDQNSNYDLQLKGKYLNEGDFILRTPLPSGILLKKKPIKGSTIYIPNTIKALGFQKK